MNRGDFQQLAELRIREAEVLLNGSYYAGAYYLAGYAIECALKACIAKLIRQDDFPDKELTKKSYTHDLTSLVDAAQLKLLLAGRKNSSMAFDINWNIVIRWSEDKRYDTNISASLASELCSAITDASDGVLTWLKTYW